MDSEAPPAKADPEKRRGRPKKSVPKVQTVSPEVKEFLEIAADISPPPIPEPPPKIVISALPPPPPPKPKRKIAILGSAISSVNFAPFNDPDWEIWGCSPANKRLPRVDVWFELHNIEVKHREGLTEWIEWLQQQPNVYLQRLLPEFKGGKEFPLKQLVDKYGRYWWTSQIAYMLALAIEQKPAVIGLYGVDMAATTEYNQQRLALQFFFMIAAQQGIELVIPPESDMLEPAPLYGYCESSRRWRKLYARKQELTDRINGLAATAANALAEKAHLVGALDDLEYQMAMWANTTDFD